MSRDEEESVNMRLSRKQKNKEKRTDPQRHAAHYQIPTQCIMAVPQGEEKKRQKEYLKQ